MLRSLSFGIIPTLDSLAYLAVMRMHSQVAKTANVLYVLGQAQGLCGYHGLHLK